MLSLVLVAQVLSAIGVIVLVLLQHGKGADMGAAFGSGSSGSLFGATGSANFLSRMTAGLAVVFFVCTLVLAFMSQRPTVRSGSVMDQPAQSSDSKAPAGAKSDVPAADGAKSEASKAEAGKSDAARPDGAKSDSGKSDTPKSDAAPASGGSPASGGNIPK